MLESKKRIKSNIVNGMATIMWADAWAQHIENARYRGLRPCQNLSGCKVEEVMPEVPKIAWQQAMMLARDLHQANGKSVVSLFADAAKANMNNHRLTEDEVLFKHELEYETALQTKFGESLAWMAMGAGVSWFDDNNSFPMNVYPVENYRLQEWAFDHCEDCYIR